MLCPIFEITGSWYYFLVFFLLCFLLVVLGSNLIHTSFSASAVSMNSIKFPKTFIMFWKSMKVTLAAFKANKTVANVTREVFQATSPAFAARRSTPASAPTLAPSLALVLAA